MGRPVLRFVQHVCCGHEVSVRQRVRAGTVAHRYQ